MRVCYIHFYNYIIHHARNFSCLIKHMRMQLIPLPREKNGPGYEANKRIVEVQHACAICGPPCLPPEKFNQNNKVPS